MTLPMSSGTWTVPNYNYEIKRQPTYTWTLDSSGALNTNNTSHIVNTTYTSANSINLKD